ncbi:nucleotidyltransferase family protein [Sphingobium yanoikuyae]|uniref:nucleotidyltransferase family protein n=1 Tax=Sphingobium yanoikuyae TaxID=13690 RepID=UPI0022DDF586|nr:nucleotidyltransferase domain-containing protein [Sphingobium yanoikuyae]WBQ15643.1 nucleotidyltransferase domain-containing protein [Sphingobium yanoikuyae]
MDRNTAIDRLKAHEAQLRAMGVVSLSLFGSTARGEQRPDSDVDVAVTIDKSVQMDLFRFAAMSSHLNDWLRVPVDLVSEPARKARFQNEIDRDRVRVF